MRAQARHLPASPGPSVFVSFAADPECADHLRLTFGADWVKAHFVSQYRYEDGLDRLFNTAWSTGWDALTATCTPQDLASADVSGGPGVSEDVAYGLWHQLIAPQLGNKTTADTEVKTALDDFTISTARIRNMKFPSASTDTPTGTLVYDKVAAYAKRFGSTPTFSANFLKDSTKAHNYIRSVYGERVEDTVLEEVRKRLAKSGL